MAAPNGAGPPAWGTGTTAQALLSAYGDPARDGSPQPRGPTGLGDGESCLGGGRCLWNAYGGWHSPTWRAHLMTGQGALPHWRRLPMERLRGDSSPQRRGTTGWGDREFCPGGNCCLRSACGGLQLPTAPADRFGGRGAVPGRWQLPMERLKGDGRPQHGRPISCARALAAAYGTPKGGW